MFVCVCVFLEALGCGVGQGMFVFEYYGLHKSKIIFDLKIYRGLNKF